MSASQNSANYPPLHLALVEPRIAPNTGNVARLCAATGCELWLVGPLGFSLADRELKRAGLDYWQLVTVHRAAALEELLAHHPWPAVYFFSAHGHRAYWDVRYPPGALLIFGSETTGLGHAVLARHASQVVTIPQLPEIRSHNLAAAVAIAAYEALRQINQAGQWP